MEFLIVITMLTGQQFGFPTLNSVTCQSAMERIVESAKRTGFRFRTIQCVPNKDQPEEGGEKKPDLSV
jgi:hypothetical protein